ncbi:valyl-tRNA synthetase [Alkalispirochaeta americana]|uniref:Valine--tRNA ligase n=1 Tax=Alkalispirochaeta americana TaxID=159291 RepID=A0A1N6UXC9_9SPIO|nr:valine--tRNA ligase [Alkalispirochaeta americana]SIQ69946.1 valyl-tRNA synthetase [Alkalispirochaeta americana]
MKAVELSKVFHADDFEDRIYRMWKENNYFEPSGDQGKDPFVIVIPPPNVTGVLHMGHGLNNSIQDTLIRYWRMQGRPTLWVPGTDHAGIATQNVVERQLLKEGTSREELGREAFLERTWQVKRDHHATITRQLEKIGASCDWNRERFTLDEGLSRAVREVFVQLYERDLIYRGEYLINWCPCCGTALSDDEVEHAEKQGSIWHLRYPVIGDGTDAPQGVADGSAGWIEVATTRPETMLGDTAVAVHPEDERYAHLVGRSVLLPLCDRPIPIVADSYVDREFGSGAVKITPAHDPNDWAIGERHNLERINLLTASARMNENAPERYRGMTVTEARAAVVEDLDSRGFLVRIGEHTHQVGHCYRCSTVVEPWGSTQWFVRMKPLAEKALTAWRDGKVQFYPRHWENTYSHWLENIRDWCISRQLWWGHRIPVWYDDATGEVIVSRTDPTTDPAYEGRTLRQDPDVLDTWFSSWLWPFSTLGWPDKTPDLATYYPTTTLVTGYDIIFFWVARMIMAGLEFMGEVPFRDIYITGLVRDAQGRKMSKSLGNGLDPLDIVAEYGADAHKFTLAYLSVQGQDIPIASESFQLGSKFANKIWNASRYLLMNLEGRTLIPREEITLRDLDRWIFFRLNEAVKTVESAMKNYRMDEAARAVYDFFWNEFCDWYIEGSKLSLYSQNEEEQDRGVSLLLCVLEEALRMMHPFLPFITEEIYQKLPGELNPVKAVIIGQYPSVLTERENPQARAAAAGFGALQELVRGIRTMRSEFTIPPNTKFGVYVCTAPERPELAAFFQANQELVALLAGIGEVEIGSDGSRREGAVTVVGSGFEAYLSVLDLIDVAAQRARVEKHIAKTTKALKQAEGKLQSQGFLAKARPEVIEAERRKAEDLRDQLGRLEAVQAELAQGTE